MIYESISLFDSIIETRDSDIIQTSTIAHKKCTVNIPYDKISRIYQQNKSSAIDAFLIEASEKGNTIAINLTSFNFKDILKEIIPKVAACKIDNDVLLALKMKASAS